MIQPVQIKIAETQFVDSYLTVSSRQYIEAGQKLFENKRDDKKIIGSEYQVGYFVVNGIVI